MVARHTISDMGLLVQLSVDLLHMLHTLPPPRSLDPAAFVEGLKKKGIRVPGIGHRIKSKV
jgi:citrate synthase